MKLIDKVIFAIVIVILIAFFTIAQQNKNCKLAGGTLVRGVFWYECVKTLDSQKEKR